MAQIIKVDPQPDFIIEEINNPLLAPLCNLHKEL